MKHNVDRTQHRGNHTQLNVDHAQRDVGHAQLPKYEISFYICAWLASYGWAVKQIFHLSNEITSAALRRGDLEVKTNYFQPSRALKDTVDFEWNSWNNLLFGTIVCTFSLHFVAMRVCDRVMPQHRFHCSVLCSWIFCVYYFGWLCLVLLILPSMVVLCVAVCTRSTTCAWLVSLGLLVPLILDSCIQALQSLITDDYILVMFICTCTMCNLRYIAFAHEYCRFHGDEKFADDNPYMGVAFQTWGNAMESLMIYQFYLPLLVGGPVINYNKFCRQSRERGIVVWNVSSTLWFVVNVARYAVHHCLIDILLYYFYVTSVHNDLRLLEAVPIVTLCGAALCYVQFFCMKYMVLYGLPSSVAAADNLDVPSAAHCVSGKHRFTDMWKYFDKGLHQWLVRYIFIPMGGSSCGVVRATVNSAVPFVFVYVWHGMHTSHLYWAMLNWFGVYVEKVAAEVYMMEWVRRIENRMSPANSRRIKAVMSSIPFSLLIVSNIYFLGGIPVGNLYMRRIYTEDWRSTCLIHLVLYFGVQTSIEVSSFKSSKVKQQ